MRARERLLSFLNKIFGGPGKADRIDYYEEGLALSKDGKFHEALTSLRLALKESPSHPVILQQIAIAYTRIGMEQEAIKTYRHVLSKSPDEAGAHYGLAFLLLRQGHRGEAMGHLEAFLACNLASESAEQHVELARRTLEGLRGGPAKESAAGEP